MNTSFFKCVFLDRYSLHEKRKKEIPKEFLEGNIPKKSAFDFLNFQSPNMSASLMQMISGQTNNAANPLSPNHVNTIGATAASNSNQVGNMVPSNQGNSLVSNPGNTLNQLPPTFVMENSNLGASSSSSGIRGIAGSNDLQVTSHNSNNNPTFATPSSLAQNPSSSLPSDSLNLDNLDLTDSFINQILCTDVKEEPIDPPPSNGDISMDQSSVNSYLHNFSNDLNFGGQSSVWSQHSNHLLQQQPQNPGGYDIKKMEE